MEMERANETGGVKTAHKNKRNRSPSGLQFKGVYFWAGLIVGLLIAAAGFLGDSRVGSVSARLLICSGLGLVFGAFGTSATIRYKGVVVAGVAAIAIVLLMIVDRIMRQSFATIQIRSNVSGATLQFDNGKTYGKESGLLQEFVFLGPKLDVDHLGLSVTLPRDTLSGESAELLFDCISKAEIEPHFGSGSVMQWRLDSEKGELSRGNKVIARVGGCDRADSRAGRAFRSLWPVNVAYAAQLAIVDSLFRNLESNSSAVRRDARLRLAALGVNGVSPLLRRLAVQPISYRTRLGIIVALTEIMRNNKASRSTIGGMTSPQDLARLLDAASDRDRTIRIYASEFLYDLGDGRVIDPAFVKIPRTDDNGRYNLILVIAGARPALTRVQRVTVDRRLRALATNAGPRTKALIDSVVAGKGAARPT
ncbi:MAG TPA: hypothetical protein VGQ52_22130 [Gemmatimonadaceae bacterium]|jgi:hypothetical protein|nr:hypothetical protein [Gemmatimonadaceae bacterium]